MGCKWSLVRIQSPRPMKSRRCKTPRFLVSATGQPGTTPVLFENAFWFALLGALGVRCVGRQSRGILRRRYLHRAQSATRHRGARCSQTPQNFTYKCHCPWLCFSSKKQWSRRCILAAETEALPDRRSERGTARWSNGRRESSERTMPILVVGQGVLDSCEHFAVRLVGDAV